MVLFLLKGKNMIPSNLKVGAKFTEENRTFEVIEVNADGTYVSKCIHIEVKPDSYISVAPVVETETVTEDYTKTDINRMPKDKLEVLCKEYELEIGTTSEMKKVLLEKLGL